MLMECAAQYYCGYKTFMRNAHTKLKLDLISDTAIFISGVIQDSGFGPLMFLVYINELAAVLEKYGITRSSADADNRRDAFRGQSSSTNMVPFWVRCDFSLSM